MLDDSKLALSAHSHLKGPEGGSKANIDARYEALACNGISRGSSVVLGCAVTGTSAGCS